MRRADLDHPFHGVRVGGKTVTGASNTASGTEVEHIIARCREYLPLLKPGQFFSHSTSARLWGCPIATNRDAEVDAVHVSTISPRRAPRGKGVIGHEVRSDRINLARRYGLPVSDAASAWIALAGMLELDELVAAADHLVLDPYQLDPRDPRPYVTVEELRGALASLPGRGSRAAASALRLVRQGAESRTETLLRLLLHRNGLPEPELNRDVYSDSGRWLGRVDLYYPDYRTIVEYDGDFHRVDRATNENDMVRRERFVNAGFAPVHVRSAGLFAHQVTTVERVTAALSRGGWRGHPRS